MLGWTFLQICTLPSYGRCYSEHLFDIANAEGEAEVEPHRVMNNGCRETVPFVRNSRHWSLREADEHDLSRDPLA